MFSSGLYPIMRNRLKQSIFISAILTLSDNSLHYDRPHIAARSARRNEHPPLRPDTPWLIHSASDEVLHERPQIGMLIGH